MGKYSKLASNWYPYYILPKKAMVSAVDIYIQRPAPPSRNGSVWVWQNGLGQKKFPFKTRINWCSTGVQDPISHISCSNTQVVNFKYTVMIYNRQLIHLVHIARSQMKLGLNYSLLGAPSWFKIKDLLYPGGNNFHSCLSIILSEPSLKWEDFISL